MESSLSTHKVKIPTLLEILERTIETHGSREFNQITKTEMTRGVPDPTIIPNLAEFWDRTTADLDHLGLTLRRTITPKILMRPLDFLKAATDFLPMGFGFLFSWTVPQKDIRFSSRKTETDAIFIHRPLVIALTILIAWLIQMLDLTGAHPQLSESDQKRLRLMKQGLNHFRNGFESGVYRKELLLKFLQTIRVFKSRQDLTLKVDPQLFHWLEIQLKNS